MACFSSVLTECCSIASLPVMILRTRRERENFDDGLTPFYACLCALFGKPGTAEQQRRDKREHRRHAERCGDRTRGERDERVAAVEHGGADADRLALAAARRRLIE